MAVEQGSRRLGSPVWDLLAAVLLVLALDAAVVLPALDGTVLRAALGLPVLLLAPGYVVVAALYPAFPSGTDPTTPRGVAAGWRPRVATPLSAVGRVALSIVLTVATVASVSFALHFSPWPIRPLPLAAGVTAVTLLGAAAAVARRAAVPRSSRPASLGDLLPPARTLRPRASTTYALNVVLVLAVLSAAAAVGYAATVPDDGDAYTEFALLSETDDGALVADDYPTTFTSGEARPVHLFVENNEGESMEYTVVVRLDAMGADNETVTQSTTLDRFTMALDDGESRTAEYDVQPTITGERLRLSFLLYTDDPPDDPDREAAHSALHLWITVDEDE